MNAAAEWIAMTPAQKLEFMRNNKPDLPDPDEPAFGESDAAANIVERLDADDLSELVTDVANAAGLLSWIAHNVHVPLAHLYQFRALADKADRLRKAVDVEYDVLNGSP